MLSNRSLLGIALLMTSVPSVQCAYPAAFRPATVGGRGVSLRYEGTCAHLACCSTYAVAVPAESPGAFRCDGRARTSCRQNDGWFTPAFTCNPYAKGQYRQPDDPPYAGCNDQERWLSLPGLGHAQCGETYLVCREGVRVTAVARDRSAGNESGKTHFEGSLGLLHALGADPTQREAFVSIYALHERDLIASDPHCVGTRP